MSSASAGALPASRHVPVREQLVTTARARSLAVDLDDLDRFPAACTDCGAPTLEPGLCARCSAPPVATTATAAHVATCAFCEQTAPSGLCRRHREAWA